MSLPELIKAYHDDADELKVALENETKAHEATLAVRAKAQASRESLANYVISKGGNIVFEGRLFSASPGHVFEAPCHVEPEPQTEPAPEPIVEHAD